MSYAYYVHSDINENNVFRDFYGRGSKQAAIKYAKNNIDQMTWVDRVELDENDELTGNAETVWSYSEAGEIVRIPCPFCNSATEVLLTYDEKKQLNRLFNEPVQNVFPNWKPEKRGLLISGICISCQKKVFG